jgi:hypothetical protein
MASIHARDPKRDEGAGERLEMPPDPLQRVVVRYLNDTGVEGDVGDGFGVGVTRIRRALHLLYVALEFFEVRDMPRSR